MPCKYIEIPYKLLFKALLLLVRIGHIIKILPELSTRSKTEIIRKLFAKVITLLVIRSQAGVERTNSDSLKISLKKKYIILLRKDSE